MRHDPVVSRAMVRNRENGWAPQAGNRQGWQQLEFLSPACVGRSRLHLRFLRLAAAFTAGWLLGALL